MPATNSRRFTYILCDLPLQNLFETMIYVCELLTEEPDGGSAMIPVRTFVRLYEYLAMLDCSGECPYVIMEDDTKEISPPSEPSTLTSIFDSKLYLVPSAVEEVKSEFTITFTPSRMIHPPWKNGEFIPEIVTLITRIKHFYSAKILDSTLI